MAAVVDIAVAHLSVFVHNESHFTARLVHWLHVSTGLDKDRLAIGISVAVLALVGLVEGGGVLANLLLVAFPLTTTYLFPAEAVHPELLGVYWTAFGVVSAVDPLLASVVSGYFVLKLFLFLAFFLRPFCFASQLLHKFDLRLRRE